jgi:hypothetical protein
MLTSLRMETGKNAEKVIDKQVRVFFAL